MCTVHLIPALEEQRVAAAEGLVCMECDEHIAADETYQLVEGALDDGSRTRYRYVAHVDCYVESYQDIDDDGCFTYGGIQELDSAS